MAQKKQLYQVFNAWGHPVGETMAVSDRQAVNNMRYRIMIEGGGIESYYAEPKYGQTEQQSWPEF